VVTDFDDAFYRCLPKAFAAARRIVGDEQVAEEVASEAMVRMHASWPKLSKADYVDAWAIRVASNLAVDAVRKRKPVLHAAPLDTADIGDRVTARVAVGAALQRLPRRQREAVALCHLAGCTEQEAATVLHVSVNTLRTHLRRGLAALHGQFKEAPTWTS